MPGILHRSRRWAHHPQLPGIGWCAGSADASLVLMNDVELRRAMANQAGLISRRQVLAHGGDDSYIEKQLRRRNWARVYPGVYIDHTAALIWIERAWAALLYYWPAALSHESALRAHGLGSPSRRSRRTAMHSPAARTTGGLTDEDRPIHVAVAKDRRVLKLPGVELHRVADLAAVVQLNSLPTRINLEHSLLDVASAAARDSDAIALLGDACQSRRTTPGRLLRVLHSRMRLRRRKFLLGVLDDVATGVYSALEHRYLTGVERPHGLPTARRQRLVRPGRTPAYRDVEYVGLRTVVELDGRLGHEESLDRWDDMSRDIDSAVSGDTTLRIGWRHVEDSCRTATAVARVLMARGWAGPLKPCSAQCTAVRDGGVSPAPDAGDTPQTDAFGANQQGGDCLLAGVDAQAQSWPSRRSSASSIVPS